MSDDRFVIDGKPYPVPTDLTLGEGCVLEQDFGVDLAKMEKGAGGLSAMAGLAWVAMHRMDASITPDHVKANVRLSQIDLPDQAEALEDESSLPPSDAASAAAAPTRSPDLAMIRAASGNRAS